MKRLLKPLGMTLLAAATAAIVAMAYWHFTFANALLLIPLAVIIAGAVMIVWGQKREN